MSTPTASLGDLHRIHQQLGDLRDRQTRGPKQIKAHQGNLARMEQELAKLHEETTRARVAADDKQLALKTGEGKIADLKRKLNEAKSNREYQALLEQIAADETANSCLEDEILDALGKIDDLQAGTAEAQQQLDRAKAELAKVETNVAEAADLIQGDITRLEGDLKTAEQGLPGDLRESYYRVMKSRGSDGMAQIEGECCGGCFQQIPPNHVNQVYLQQAVLCSSCGRLLYLPEDRSPGRK